MLKNSILLIAFWLSISVHAQQEIFNNYKYIIVPEKFDFLNKNDQYDTSSLTKFLLKKNGFSVYLASDNLPIELQQNRCLALTASVVDNSSMFSVKNTITFTDCSGKVVFTSKEGKSKDKDYKKAYHEAIRNAYASLASIKYNSENVGLKTDNTTSVVADKVITKEVLAKPETILVEAVKSVSESSKNSTNNIKKVVKTKKLKSSLTTNAVLYAQAIENGFQLVNTTPKVVFQMLKTKMKDVFILNNKNGILYKTATSWTAEYYENGVLVLQEYQIKF